MIGGGGIFDRSIAGLTLWLLFLGCASMSPQERTYWACTAVDMGTTVWGLEQGFEEANPLVQSDTTTTAVVSMAVISGAIGYGLHRLEKKNGQRWPWLVVGAPHCLAAMRNADTITGDDG